MGVLSTLDCCPEAVLQKLDEELTLLKEEIHTLHSQISEEDEQLLGKIELEILEAQKDRLEELQKATERLKKHKKKYLCLQEITAEELVNSFTIL